MELSRLVRASGFFLSGATSLSVAVMLLDLIQSNLISLAGFAFIVPLFIFGIVLRGLTWKRFYRSSHDLLYLFTSIAVLVLGFAFLISVLLYASTQTILYYLSGYSGAVGLLLASLFWVVYSALEFVSLFRVFRNGIFRLARLLIVPIALTEISLAFVIGTFSYALPISLILLAGVSVLTGVGFLRGAESIAV